jgi:uncharacterized protein (UPF0335 family)
MSGPLGVVGDQLRAIVERIEHVEKEIKELTGAKKEIYLEAKSDGFDVKIIREVIRLRKQDPKERDELETLVETIGKQSSKRRRQDRKPPDRYLPTMSEVVSQRRDVSWPGPHL